MRRVMLAVVWLGLGFAPAAGAFWQALALLGGAPEPGPVAV